MRLLEAALSTIKVKRGECEHNDAAMEMFDSIKAQARQANDLGSLRDEVTSFMIDTGHQAGILDEGD